MKNNNGSVRALKMRNEHRGWDFRYKGMANESAENKSVIVMIDSLHKIYICKSENSNHLIQYNIISILFQS